MTAHRDKLMFVTPSPVDKPIGGRELLSRLNSKVLRNIYGERFIRLELPAQRMRGVKAAAQGLRGHVDGVSAETIRAAVALIRELQVNKVFVDGSNLGSLVTALKRQMPSIQVTTFFHNVEARFFWGAWRLHKTTHGLGVLIANAVAEYNAVKCSDKRICLSARDSELLKRIYGAGATHIAPMVLEDKCPPSLVRSPKEPSERFALFVGGTFYANRAGIGWFVREVAPRMDLPLFIVGRGFDSLRSDLEIPGKVIVVGEVDSLAEWYKRARFVIAPIFDGSGMKTKVAEALMYGKRIVGTPEAFSGYGDIARVAGWVCETADEFVAAMEHASKEDTPSFDLVSRRLYEELYSLAAAKERFENILGRK
jgi:polysaccharide biosynthesis protein PslH